MASRGIQPIDPNGITPDEIARMREGLRGANWPELDSASDQDVINKYMEIAADDPFKQSIKQKMSGGGGGASGAPAPGSLAADSDKAIRALDTWYQDFRKRNNGRHPTDEELTAAWGEYGMATRRYVDGLGGLPANKEDVFKALSDLAVKIPPSGSVGVAYAPPPDLNKQKFDYQKDYDAKKLAADDARDKANKAYQDAQIALSQGNQALAQQQFALSQQQFAYSKEQDQQANAIQVAGLTGTYNGNPTLAMQQFTQNQANFEKQFGLSLDQFNFEKDKFAKEYGLQEAQVTGMFQGNPTLAMQQFLENKDQFAKNFGLAEAGVTGVYKGAPTLAATNAAMDRAIAQGNLTGKFVDPQTGQSYETLAAQAQTFNQGLAAGALTGTYNGAPTEAARQFNITAQQSQDQIAYNAARAGNVLQYLQATRGIGAPLQNYEGLTIGQGVAPQNMAPGYNPGGTRTPLPQGGPVVNGQQNTMGYKGSQPTEGWNGQQVAAGNLSPASNPQYSAAMQAKEQEKALAQGGQELLQAKPAQMRYTQENMAPGYQQPQMPGNISAVLSGAPLPAYGMGSQPPQNMAPGGPYQLRAAGAQAQANEGQLGKASRYEAYELAGVRGEDLAESEARIKRNLGTGLAPASYRGY